MSQGALGLLPPKLATYERVATHVFAPVPLLHGVLCLERHPAAAALHAWRGAVYMTLLSSRVCGRTDNIDKLLDGR